MTAALIRDKAAIVPAPQPSARSGFVPGVTTVILTVGSLGAAGVVAATIAGQLTISVVIDRLGILGLEQTPITPARVLGVALRDRAGVRVVHSDRARDLVARTAAPETLRSVLSRVAPGSAFCCDVFSLV